MVLDLFALTGTMTAVGGAEAVHQQRVLDQEANSEARRAPFYLDVYCDAQSRKRDEVHGATVILRDGKLRLWPKDPKTDLPKPDNGTLRPPHAFRGFYLPFPDSELPLRPIPSRPVLGLVSTIPPDTNSSAKPAKEKLNWIYADKETRELRYGPRIKARDHVIGPWDWTEDDEQGLTLDGEESMVAVEEECGGKGWAVYWDWEDNRLKSLGIGREKRVLRCSLERRLVEKKEEKVVVE